MDFSIFRNFKEYTDQCGTEQFMYKLRDVINEHLVALDGNFRYYFNDMIENVKQYDWLRNPFLCEESVVSHLPFSTQEEFVQLRSDRTLELNFKNQALVDFWVGIRNEFPELHKSKIIAIAISNHLSLRILVFSNGYYQNKESKQDSFGG